MTLRIPVRLGGSKYRAIRTEVDEITFASKKEAKRYGELKLLEKVGRLRDLRLQARFTLTVIDKNGNHCKVGEYVADFVYLEAGEHIVEDTKGFRTPLYRWKKKHFEAQYGIQIQEV